MLKFRNKAGLPVANGVMAALTGLLAIELYLAVQSPGYRPLPAAVAVPASNGKGDAPQSAVAAWRAAMLGRPLFDLSRRPPAPAVQTLAMPELPRLSGIMITPTEKIAVFLPPMGAPIIVAENSRFGVFTVLSISDDCVTVKGPDGTMVLRSDFGYQRRSGKPTPDSKILPGGIDLSLIRVPLPSAATWIGPPMVN